MDNDGNEHDSRRVFRFSYTGIYSHPSKRYDAHGKWRYEIGQECAVIHASDNPNISDLMAGQKHLLFYGLR